MPPWFFILLIIAAAVAAKQKRQREEEEEDMTPLEPDPAVQFEYKILRSSTGAFNNSAKFRAALEAEARAGWELFEKLDHCRLRLRRPTSCRERDVELQQDPYRTSVGLSAGTMIVFIGVGTAVAVGAMVALLFLFVK